MIWAYRYHADLEGNLEIKRVGVVPPHGFPDPAQAVIGAWWLKSHYVPRAFGTLIRDMK